MTVPPDTLFRRWLIALAACVVLVLLSITYLDRPVAVFAYEHFTQTKLARTVNHVFEWLELSTALLIAIQVALGVMALRGRPIPPWGVTPLIAAWSGSWALAVVTGLKRFFGRAQVYPGYLVHHIDGFRWLHGNGGEFQAFPSGTMGVAGAILAAIWIRHPRFTLPGVGALAVTLVALVMTNSHWLSDTLAGAFVGCSIGWMSVALYQRRAG